MEIIPMLKIPVSAEDQMRPIHEDIHPFFSVLSVLSVPL